MNNEKLKQIATIIVYGLFVLWFDALAIVVTYFSWKHFFSLPVYFNKYGGMVGWIFLGGFLYTGYHFTKKFIEKVKAVRTTK